MVIRFSFNLAPVGSVVPHWTWHDEVSATRSLVNSHDWQWTQPNEATAATRATVPAIFWLRPLLHDGVRGALDAAVLQKATQKKSEQGLA
ncbi:hypothetical protein [Paraburkholderia elongata]|uniref:hypothetical protein n=1 Tax=Paraburkholderia elongata TaxID=2675747 RepID=UPI00155244A3|nr:hypothetical protein [Paraburkholderia elongata]